jgi:heat-inducible transcriptional repressor
VSRLVSDRALDVLRVIVQDYISSSEPVASKAIAERPGFGVSAATIRNDMAVLEEEDLITAPHTSAGRIPTDKGYRVFVDQLTQLRPLSPAQRSAIGRFLDTSGDMDDMLARSVRLLAQLTQQVALIQYPTFGSGKVRHVELLMVSSSRLMVVFITDSGRVDQSIVDLPDTVDEALTGELRATLNAALDGVALEHVSATLQGVVDSVSPERRAVMSALVEALGRALDAHRSTRLVMAGASNLVKTESDFPHSVYPVLEAIEEQVTVLKIFSEMAADGVDVGTRIGREMGDPLGETSLVSSTYQAGADESGSLGVLGPTRMDYSTNMEAVRAVAKYLSRILTPPTGED